MAKKKKAVVKKKKKAATKKKVATKKKAVARKKAAIKKQSPETDSTEDTTEAGVNASEEKAATKSGETTGGPNTMEIPKGVLALHKIADPESCRYALGQTRIENHNGEVCGVATDGRGLAALSWQGRVPENRGQKPIALAHASAKALHKQVPKNSSIVLWCGGEGGASLTATGPKGLDMNVEEDEGRFPKWWDVVPPDEEKAVRVKLDLDLFIGVLRAVKEHVVNEEGVSKATFQILGEEKAVKITAQGVEGRSAVAALMPIY